ncbi:MAG: CoA transferase subunit A [Candidatus Lokiarchaeota archaeon]|nr:CoA transferase subunit A [Candidatus Lokiarchaeota archaeon]
MGSSKLITLEDAISTYVNDGDLVGIGGLSFWRKAISACREIIRQDKKDLTICTFVGGIDVDMLIAAGCVSEVRSCFVGMEIFGMAPHYRKAVESGSIRISEESEATIALGLRASYLKVPFMPLKGIIGTDLEKVRKDIKQIEDPLGSGTQVMAVPKIDLDVAILHVPYADELGNGNIPGAVWMDADMAKTAKKTIIICEKLVETEDIRYLPGKAQLPQQTTDAVVKLPFGAHPTSCYPIYTYDPIHIQKYLKTNFNEYKEKFILGKTPTKYLEEAGGIQTIFNILL